MKIEGKISELLHEKFTEEEFTDCFLIEISVRPKNKLVIYIDSDSGVTFQKCQRISRHLEQYLDSEGWLGEKYTLEVSSPGIGRPLKLRRQYPRNIGREMEIVATETEGPLKGKLIAVTDEAITLETVRKFKEGKKKKTETVQHVIPFEKIKRATVKISFSKS